MVPRAYEKENEDPRPRPHGLQMIDTLKSGCERRISAPSSPEKSPQSVCLYARGQWESPPDSPSTYPVLARPVATGSVLQTRSLAMTPSLPSLMEEGPPDSVDGTSSYTSLDSTATAPIGNAPGAVYANRQTKRLRQGSFCQPSSPLANEHGKSAPRRRASAPTTPATGHVALASKLSRAVSLPATQAPHVFASEESAKQCKRLLDQNAIVLYGAGAAVDGILTAFETQHMVVKGLPADVDPGTLSYILQLRGIASDAFYVARISPAQATRGGSEAHVLVKNADADALVSPANAIKLCGRRLHFERCDDFLVDGMYLAVEHATTHVLVSWRSPTASWELMYPNACSATKKLVELDGYTLPRPNVVLRARASKDRPNTLIVSNVPVQGTAEDVAVLAATSCAVRRVPASPDECQAALDLLCESLRRAGIVADVYTEPRDYNGGSKWGFTVSLQLMRPDLVDTVYRVLPPAFRSVVRGPNVKYRIALDKKEFDKHAACWRERKARADEAVRRLRSSLPAEPKDPAGHAVWLRDRDERLRAGAKHSVVIWPSGDKVFVQLQADTREKAAKEKAIMDKKLAQMRADDQRVAKMNPVASASEAARWLVQRYGAEEVLRLSADDDVMLLDRREDTMISPLSTLGTSMCSSFELAARTCARCARPARLRALPCGHSTCAECVKVAVHDARVFPITCGASLSAKTCCREPIPLQAVRAATDTATFEGCLRRAAGHHIKMTPNLERCATGPCQVLYRADSDEHKLCPGCCAPVVGELKT